MQRTLCLAAALAALAGGSAFGQAQSRFALADANNDGVITRAEWQARVHADLVALDANGDGVLAAEERQAQLAEQRQALRDRVGAPGAPAGPAFAGPISIKDMEARALTRFDRIDADGDGKVTVADLQAQRPGLRPPGGGGR